MKCCCWYAVTDPRFLVSDSNVNSWLMSWYLIRQLKWSISAHWIIIISWLWVNRHQHLSQKMKDWIHGWEKENIVLLQYILLGRTFSFQAHNFLSVSLKQLIVKCIGAVIANSLYGTLKISRAQWLSTTGGKVWWFSMNDDHKNMLVHLKHGGTVWISIGFEEKWFQQRLNKC